eukprot:524378-Hanusia_phi.AAC.13
MEAQTRWSGGRYSRGTTTSPLMKSPLLQPFSHSYLGMSAAKRNYSGLQKQVLGLFRECLRVARTKSNEMKAGDVCGSFEL